MVAAALRARSGLWLMHQRPAEKHHGGLWEFPGGKVDPGETPEIALIRELDEELAIRVLAENLDFAGSARGSVNAGHPAIVIELYTCTSWRGEPDPQEGGSVGWFALDEIKDLPKPPLDEQLLERLMQKHRA
ncbi:(deoxy)nucleoside triphosphate pyrophosphohydrolase [Altererythrobacter sp. GH1-8]|uniref:(deoxy)nucleoside triphosphate pyrophosphohydrolase n=1 Tax=Altererythrobacter sp. GH1-8 TaxID=3349333 RepID=UPI00374D9BCA